jgi:hypothetical protein
LLFASKAPSKACSAAMLLGGMRWDRPSKGDSLMLFTRR